MNDGDADDGGAFCDDGGHDNGDIGDISLM